MTNGQPAGSPTEVAHALVVDRGHRTYGEVASLLRASGYLVVDEHVAVQHPLRSMIERAQEPVLIILSPRPKRTLRSTYQQAVSH